MQQPVSLSHISIPHTDGLPSAAEISVSRSIRLRKSHCTACGSKSDDKQSNKESGKASGKSCKNCGDSCGNELDSLQTPEEQKFFNDYFGFGDQIHRLVEVEFRGQRRSLFSNPKNLQLSLGEPMIVDTDKGQDLGRISAVGSIAKHKLKTHYSNEQPQYSIIRLAVEKDLEQHRDNILEQPKILYQIRHLAKKHIPLMKVSEVEWQFDKQRLTIYFTAPERVDFRDLVRNLAVLYRARIEMRQIPARMESKRIGGIGPCGLELCCSTFLRDFDQVTVEHAQLQQLPNNMTKLSGMCGRLKCCLLYEVDNYVSALKNYPPLDSIIKTPEGDAKMIKIDIFKDIVYVIVQQTHQYATYTLQEVNEFRRSGKILFAN